ncbi:MAG: segregation/condensation protein A [Candidatus Nanoarchaeia archaeon]|nr:segregation/condensation protein A [Candidatus Nanoarchaeia archaeon]
MDFKKFLPENNEVASSSDESDENSKNVEKLNLNQFYDVISGRNPDWQVMIFELINSEQLDPWDIDIIILTKKYFEKLEEMQEADFYISSKILLAAALLLRIKSEFLLNRYIKSIDEILFGKKEENKYVLEKIEINEDELPLLIPKTPLSRLKKVTLPELLMALDKAINTESRRIKKEVAVVRAKKLSEVDFPTFKRVDLKDRIKHFYARILTFLKKKATEDEQNVNKIGYSSMVGKDKEEKISCFLPLLHLSNTQKLWLEQEKHLDEIYIYLYEYFQKNRGKFMDELEKDIEEMKEEIGLETSEKLENLDESEEIKKELKKESVDEKIDNITGFKNEAF